MKPTSYFYVFIALVFTACKKDPPLKGPGIPPPAHVESVTEYFPLTVGSYWVYHKYTIDTNLIEQFEGIDTIFIVRDTIINNRTFYLQKGNFFSKNHSQFIADSANFIIHDDGHLLFSHNNFHDTLMTKIYSNYSTTYYKMVNNDAIVQVPAGTFTSVIEREKTTYFDNPNYSWGNPRTSTRYYAKGVGMVKEREYYDISSEWIEIRLIKSYIAP